jgi:hypothetical protein
MLTADVHPDFWASWAADSGLSIPVSRFQLLDSGLAVLPLDHAPRLPVVELLAS